MKKELNIHIAFINLSGGVGIPYKPEDKENDILYSCHKLGIDIEEIANKYLQRTIEEVKNRITYLSRYYDF